MQERSNPVGDVSKHVRDALLTDLRELSDVDDMRSVYYPEDGSYILSLPTLGVPRSWVFNTMQAFEDPDTRKMVFPVTTWDLAPNSMVVNSGWCSAHG